MGMVVVFHQDALTLCFKSSNKVNVHIEEKQNFSASHLTSAHSFFLIITMDVNN